jgi:hypothetical protein
MKIYTGKATINNSRFDRTYRFRVFATSYHMAAARAIKVAKKEFRLSQGRTKIAYMGIPHIEQLSNPVIPAEWVDQAWLIV